jgi:hypothetical protein
MVFLAREVFNCGYNTSACATVFLSRRYSQIDLQENHLPTDGSPLLHLDYMVSQFNRTGMGISVSLKEAEDPRTSHETSYEF